MGPELAHLHLRDHCMHAALPDTPIGACKLACTAATAIPTAILPRLYRQQMLVLYRSHTGLL